MFFTILIAVLAGAAEMPADFVSSCRHGVEEASGYRWLGSGAVEINRCGTESVTDRCRQEGKKPLPQESLEEVAGKYACDTPLETKKAMAVAYVNAAGVICVGLDRECDQYEIALLHLVAEEDGDEFTSDAWLAYGTGSIEGWAKESGRRYTIFHVGSATPDTTFEQALEPLRRLNIIASEKVSGFQEAVISGLDASYGASPHTKFLLHGNVAVGEKDVEVAAWQCDWYVTEDEPQHYVQIAFTGEMDQPFLQALVDIVAGRREELTGEEPYVAVLPVLGSQASGEWLVWYDQAVTELNLEFQQRPDTTAALAAAQKALATLAEKGVLKVNDLSLELP